jgi:hypothetical protein
MSAFNPTTPQFKQNARDALANPNIQRAMSHAQSGCSPFSRLSRRARLATSSREPLSDRMCAA